MISEMPETTTTRPVTLSRVGLQMSNPKDVFIGFDAIPVIRTSLIKGVPCAACCATEALSGASGGGKLFQ